MIFGRPFLFIVFIVIVFSGCGKDEDLMLQRSTVDSRDTSKQPTRNSSETTFQKFFIYADKGSRKNHYIPSGFMGSSRCVAFQDAWQEDCHSGKTCIRIEYDTECSSREQGWAGVYWLNPANNWGRRKGGYNLSGAQRLTFWARGERGGEHIREFIMGGIEGDYPDSDKSVLGPVLLSKEWRQYTFDLRGKNLFFISGGFAWTTRDPVDHKNLVFYLDHIVYE